MVACGVACGVAYGVNGIIVLNTSPWMNSESAP